MSIRRHMKDGAIFYERLSNPSEAVLEAFHGYDYWKQYYYAGLSEFHALPAAVRDNNSKILSVGDYLISLGKTELKNELRWLSEVFNINGYDAQYVLEHYDDFIRVINQVSGVGENFNNILKELNDKANGKNRAGVVPAYFDQYFTTAFSRYIGGIKNAAELKPSQWEEKFKEAVEYGINEGIELMAKATDKKGDEKTQSWGNLSAAFELLKKDTQAFGQFKDIILRSFNLEEAFEAAKEWKLNSSNNIKNKTTLRQSVVKKISSRDREVQNRSAIGLLDEFLSNQTFVVTADLYSGNTSVKGKNLTSNIATTDTVTLYSGTAEIDFTEMIEALDNNMRGNSKKAINQHLTKWLEKYQFALNDKNIFVEYSNNKLQGLGDSFDSRGGFEDGGKKKLMDAPSIINRAGNGNYLPITTIYKLFNTVEGAMFEGARESIELNVKLALTSAIASLLFDDWQMIGVPNSNAIHVFTLNYVKIPLSFLLIKLGESVKVAASNINNYVHIEFQLYKPKYTKTKTPASTKNEVLEYWDEQAALMKAQSTFTVNFMAELKNMVSKLQI